MMENDTHNPGFMSYSAASSAAEESWYTAKAEGIKEVLNRLHELNESPELIDKLIKEFYNDITKGTSVTFYPGEQFASNEKYVAGRNILDKKYKGDDLNDNKSEQRSKKKTT